MQAKKDKETTYFLNWLEKKKKFCRTVDESMNMEYNYNEIPL